ncbi:hypothetical protein [Nibricoccus sp. IMCC34717]|uniref:hypothetical protein n=1 Tax=Nibricoccus sp. IMCC34717 TaxID=3034021 RepID=UPI00384BB285
MRRSLSNSLVWLVMGVLLALAFTSRSLAVGEAPDFQTSGGCVRLELFPERLAGAAALASVGEPGDGWVLFALPSGGGRWQVGVERVGAGASVWLSETLPITAQAAKVSWVAGAFAPSGGESFVMVDGITRLRFPEATKERACGVVGGLNHVGGQMALKPASGAIANLHLLSVDAMAAALRQEGPDRKGDLGECAALSLVVRAAPGDAGALISRGGAQGSEALIVTAREDRTVSAAWFSPQNQVEAWRPLRVPMIGDSRCWVNLPGRETRAMTELSAFKSHFLSRYVCAFWEDELLLFGPAEAGSIVPLQIGQAVVGRSSGFAGRVLEVQPVDRDELFERLQRVWRSGSARKDAYPGGFRMDFAAAPVEGLSHPLVSVGMTGAADFVVWKALPNGRAVVGLDHWGVPTFFGTEFAVPKGAFSVEVRMGSLVDPGDSEAAQRWRDRVEVRLNGQRVLELAQSLYPASPANILVGANLQGGSVCGQILEAPLTTVQRLGAAEAR